jgi:exopolyphosphatase/guanosine-5'-triphosphate,3'-diphosphate pyrophosphatase
MSQRTHGTQTLGRRHVHAPVEHRNGSHLGLNANPLDPWTQPQQSDGARPDDVRPVAVLDMGASALRLVVAESAPDGPIRVLEEASRGVLLGKETFTHGRIGAATMDAALRALEGFRRIMDGYGVVRYRAVATSAVREAANRDAFLDRVRLRTGLEVEVIDGSEENRLTYMAVRKALHDHEALSAGNALLVEVGGGSGDLSFLRRGEPVQSGTYALGSIRMRQSLASWHGTHEQRMRLLRRHIHNVVDDIRREMPLREVTHFIALGGDVRFAAARALADQDNSNGYRVLPRDTFVRFYDEVVGNDVEDLVEKYRLPLADAETLVPALMAYRELLSETAAEHIVIPEASLRAGLLLDLVGTASGKGFEDLRRQVLASAVAFGEKYRYDATHARNVATLSLRLFDELKSETGLSERDRLLLEVAALLHDVGIFIALNGHHKHSFYILSSCEIFGLTQDDMQVVANVARYHRRSLPQKTHQGYIALDRDRRVDVMKMAAILRVANALDADHMQKVANVRILRDEEPWVLETEGAGDLTMERLAALGRSDLFTEVFGRRLIFREASPTP